jgi:pimeloyl-ACP methyl ester carboxylesterase
VHTPTLSGLCERSHLLSPEIGLKTHVADVTNVIRWEELTDVVLCGHSYGGCVISGVAHQEPDRISALVFLDAFILEHGQSLFARLADGAREQQLDVAQRFGEGWKIPPPRAAALNVNAADRAWVDRQCTPQPLLTFMEPLDLSRGLPEAARKTFIHASGWRDKTFTPFRVDAAQRGWSVAEVDCGHDVMLDQPSRLAELLVMSAQAQA